MGAIRIAMILLSLMLDNKYKIINLLTCKAASIQNSLHKKYAPNPSSKAEVPHFIFRPPAIDLRLSLL